MVTLAKKSAKPQPSIALSPAATAITASRIRSRLADEIVRRVLVEDGGNRKPVEGRRHRNAVGADVMDRQAFTHAQRVWQPHLLREHIQAVAGRSGDLEGPARSRRTDTRLDAVARSPLADESLEEGVVGACVQ